MKQRLISAAIAVAICIYPLLFGGITLKILMFLIGLVGSYEFVKSTSKTLNYVLLIIMELTYIGIFFFNSYLISIMFFEILLLFFVGVNDKEVSVEQIFGVTAMSFIVGICITYIVYLYESGMGSIFFYILLASLLCDSGAYFVGRKLGKHKLNERVSPKKTIEGSIGGVITGFIFSFVYAYFMGFMGLPVWLVVICSIILPIISELGDLAFSLIKRHYGIKDFGNIMPGHGGVLDRIDSVIFCLIFFIALAYLLL